MQRKLSFIVPLYNSSKWMRKCIDSLLTQDIPHEDYEIILVDDGSPDDSGQIAEEYASNHHNIQVIHQQNKGASGARNTGIKHAVGKYVWFVDPDDYIDNNCTAQLIGQMEREDLDMLRFDYELVDEAYHLVKKHPSEKSIDYSSEILDGDSFLNKRMGTRCYIWAFIYKLSIITNNNILFYEGDYYDDTPWTPRVIRASRRIDSIPSICYYYLQRPDSLVRNKRLLDKQIAGNSFLLEELNNQKAESSDIAKLWYDRMIAHCVVSQLTLYAINRSWSDTIDIIHSIKQKKLFPLSKDLTEHKLFRKISIINFSPILFCFFIRLKNKK